MHIETGSYDYRTRVYAAQLGRFVSRDPVGYENRQANLHEYVNGRPSVALDPSGLKKIGAYVFYPWVPPSGDIDWEFCPFLFRIIGRCCTVGQIAVFKQRCETDFGEELVLAHCNHDKRCQYFSCGPPKKDCECGCLWYDGRGNEAVEWKGTMTKSDCESIPRRDSHYHRCFCKDKKKGK